MHTHMWEENNDQCVYVCKQHAHSWNRWPGLWVTMATTPSPWRWPLLPLLTPLCDSSSLAPYSPQHLPEQSSLWYHSITRKHARCVLHLLLTHSASAWLTYSLFHSNFFVDVHKLLSVLNSFNKKIQLKLYNAYNVLKLSWSVISFVFI